MPTYRITTLGCRVNHAETRDLEAILISRGLDLAEPGAIADLEVVHTCSVTGNAAAKSRHAMRRAQRRQAAEATAVDAPSAPPASDGPGSLEGIVSSGLGQGRASTASSGIPQSGTPDAETSTTSSLDAGSIVPGPGDHRAPREAARCVLVTGCYAETNRGEAASILGDARGVLPPEEKDGSTLNDRFAARLDAWLESGSSDEAPRRGTIRNAAPGCSTAGGALAATAAAPSAMPEPRPLPPPPLLADAAPRRAARHARAELRIQDGCDAHCTFCIIPRIRRTLRSKRIGDAVAEAKRLVDLGHREIVLTGIFLGAYGHETALRRRQHARHAAQPPTPLADLLHAVAGVPGLARLRLSSLEPGDVDAALLDAMAAHAPIVVPHLHLPLQSGSDAVLRRMNRQYDAASYRAMIDAVESALTTDDGLPPAITTDVICGFPGETEEDFAETVALARRVGYLHMHVFPYSPRAGTAAARWRRDAVPHAVRAERVRTLIDLEGRPDGLARRYMERLVGRRVRVILEQPVRGADGMMSGRCDHYALVHVETALPRGSVVEVEVVDVVDVVTEGDAARGDRRASGCTRNSSAEPVARGRVLDARLPLPVLA